MTNGPLEFSPYSRAPTPFLKSSPFPVLVPVPYYYYYYYYYHYYNTPAQTTCLCLKTGFEGCDFRHSYSTLKVNKDDTRTGNSMSWRMCRRLAGK